MDRRTFLRIGLAAAAGAGLLTRSEPAGGAPAQPGAGPYGSTERPGRPGECWTRNLARPTIGCASGLWGLYCIIRSGACSPCRAL